jgi:fluoride exporter
VIWVAVAVAGALGAACRHVVDWTVSTRTGGRLPWGTAVVNVTGSLAAGVVLGLAAEAVIPTEMRIVVAGGFLGAYTTFSTAMVESVVLFEDRRPQPAVVNVVMPMVLSVAAAATGWLLAT